MRGLTVARTAALVTLLSLVACAGPVDRPAAEPPATPRDETPSAAPSRADGPSSSSSPSATTTYQASVRRIGPRVARRMRFSHRPGCPVSLADLRLLRMTYVGFDGRPRTGELVVNEDHATAVTQVFHQLYDARWRVARMRLVDDYGADDDRSMAADNTSAYNCRRVAGGSEWSEHAYGAAIDVNPVQNPYVTDGLTSPPGGRRFAAIDRSPGAAVPRGAVRDGDVVVRAFARIGWEWGGEWSSAKDYQHFSASGR